MSATVAEIMTIGVVSLRAKESVQRAARRLTEIGAEGAPVQDAAGRVFGMVSKSDLVDPSQSGSRTVEDVMSPVVLAVSVADEVMTAVRRMAETGAHRLLVLDALDQPVGIVTPMDVLKALADGRLTLRDGG